MSSKQTKFNKDWIKDPAFSSWVGVDPNSETKARCMLCGYNFELGNMGKKSLVSHANGKKHKLKHQLSVKVKQEIKPLDVHFGKVAPSSSAEDKPLNTTDMVVPPPPPLPPAQKPTTSGMMSSYVVRDEVLTAEILWAMKTVVSHYSVNSSEKTSNLFQKMFPDSAIAKKFKCGKTKCAYFIQFGLANCFKEELSTKVQKPGAVFVVCFDESLNKVLQEEQMDLHLRFWDNELNKVVTRYFDSVFLGHTRSGDLLVKFNEALLGLNMSNMLQISMDGPNTNWKFYDTFVQKRHDSDADIPMLLNIGSCGLHVVHGAFKYGASKTGWKLDGIMRAVYHCFNDTPARREDYLVANKGSAQFALQFCSTRWLEDVPVAERAIKIWPNIKTYISAEQKLSKSQQPKCQSYINLTEYSQDQLVPAKLHFFITIAKILVPFLELFQTDKPMVPFLCSGLENIMTNLLQRFVKKQCLESTTNVSKIDVFKKDNLVSPDKVDVGFAAKQVVDTVLKEKKASPLRVLEFQKECITFLQHMVGKLQERCPLKYATVKAMDCLDPALVCGDPEKAVEKMGSILQKLLNNKWLTASKCDECLQEFKQWIREEAKEESEQLSSFDKTKDRLDELYYNLMGVNGKYKSLWEVVKMVLMMSHGQSTVERGFSTNKDILKTNMGKETLKAFRIVYDGLVNAPKERNTDKETGEKEKGQLDVSQITVTKKMLEACRNARRKYDAYLEEEKMKKVASVEETRKKTVQEQLTTLKGKKRKLESCAETLLKEADDLAQEAEKKMKWDLVTKSNAFREKAKEKKKQVEQTGKEIETLEKTLKKM